MYRSKMRKAVTSLSIIATAVLTIVACGSGGAKNSGPPILIGVTAPLSGPYAADGTDMLNAAKVTAREINSQGGVIGRRLKIVSADDQCSAQDAVQAAENLIDQGVVAFAGGYCSGATIPLLPILKRAGSLPLVAAGAASDDLIHQGYSNIFMMQPPTSLQAPLMGSFLLQLMHRDRIAIMDDNTSFALGLADGIKTYVKKHSGRVTYFAAITPGQSDYSAEMTRVASSNPNAFVYTGYYPEAGKLATEYKALGLSSKFLFMGGGGVYDPGYLTAAGPSADGTYLIFTPNLSSFSGGEVDTFKKDYTASVGHEPGDTSVFESDSVNVIAAAIRKGNSAKPADITKALHKITFNGITGKVKFYSDGQRTFVPLVVYVVNDGQYQLFAKLNNSGAWAKASG